MEDKTKKLLEDSDVLLGICCVKLRSGVETAPANLRRNYHLEKLPRGKQKGKLSLEVK